jgi:hypothetical protein
MAYLVSITWWCGETLENAFLYDICEFSHLSWRALVFDEVNVDKRHLRGRYQVLDLDLVGMEISVSNAGCCYWSI